VLLSPYSALVSLVVKCGQCDAEVLEADQIGDDENKWEAFGAVLAAGENGRWKKNSIIECSGNISDFGSQTRVRVNFQTKTLNNRGEVMSVGQINEPAFYSTFFAKVDKGHLHPEGEAVVLARAGSRTSPLRVSE